MKYLKINSLTWWASATPLTLGLVAATEPIHGLAGAGEVVANLTGGMSPYQLINAGLIGVGLRGALT